MLVINAISSVNGTRKPTIFVPPNDEKAKMRKPQMSTLAEYIMLGPVSKIAAITDFLMSLLLIFICKRYLAR